jgi:tetratricopeptide (TPR) repeat protein
MGERNIYSIQINSIKWMFIFLGVIHLLPHRISAQSIQKKILESAIEATQAGDIATAVFYYRSYLDKDSLDAEIWFQFGKCNEKIFLYRKAIYAYEKVQKLDVKKTYKELSFSLAVCNKITGEYKKAIKLYDKAARANKKRNPQLYEQCLKDKKICEDALIQQQTGVFVKKLPPTVNKEDAEYSPFYKDSTLYFVRKEEGEGKVFHYLMSIRDNEKKPQKIKVYYPSGEEALMVGGLTFHPKNNEIICTLCKEESKKINCKLYNAQLDSVSLRASTLLPLPINEEGFTFTHPSLFELDGKTKLIFSSNRPGGQGGMDLWISEKNTNGIWSNPENAGPAINTSGNEITPSFCNPCYLLFFSSDGHEGLGNFDVFQSKFENNVFSKIENPGWMINSGYNDLYPMYDKKSNQLFFASNRLEAKQTEKEACCNNLFSLTQIKEGKTEEEKAIIDSIVLKKSILKSLLPLSLFFNNDEPDPKTKKTKTNFAYDETYIAYIKQRQKYVSEYSKGLTYDNKIEAIEEIETFFEDSVIAGFQDLEKFSKQLPSLLEKGDKIQLTFKGFCSPLASSEYNIALAQRRISSLVNYFYQYQNGALVPYFEKKQLSITTEDIGELKASPMISDNPLDKAGSVYSRKAAAERKIQIIAVQFE